MIQTHKRPVLLTGLVALLFLLAACGTLGMASTIQLPPAGQTLQKSANAMSHLKSVHFDLQTAVDIQSSPGTTSFLTGMKLNITGHGDAVAPDKASATLALGSNPLLALIRVGQKVYVQKQDGSWYVLNEKQITDGTQHFFSQSPAKDLGTFLSDLQQAQLTDHGLQSLKGETLDHITATLNQKTLHMLDTLLNGLLPKGSQNTQNQIKQASLDFWIDPATSYVHQATLHTTMQIDLNKLPQFGGLSALGLMNSSSTMSIKIDAQINFSKFNQSLQIQAPSGAEPLPQN